MRKRWAIPAIILFVLGLTACAAPKAFEAPGPITGIYYSRSNGSAYGRQFMLHITPTEIMAGHYFPKEGGQFTEVADVEISEEQWNMAKAAAEKVYPRLEAAHETLGDKLRNLLRKKYVVDGTDKYKFILTFETADGTEDVEFEWVYTEEGVTMHDVLYSIAAGDEAEG